jgi:patatin-like phospholipase/acyl hydrolase
LFVPQIDATLEVVWKLLEAFMSMVSPFQILALTGGGFRGLYTAQVMADIENDTGKPIAQSFDLLAGTSVGGILALAAACEIPMCKVVSLFTNHGAEIFKKRNFFSSWGGYLRSQYSSDGLEKLLSSSDIFGDRLLSDALHPVIVPSINFTKGFPVVFKTPHHPSLKRDHTLKLVDIALATSAAPAYFPRHVFDNQQFIDGGLCANNPALLALHEADYFFEKPLECINMLSIGTLSAKLTVNPKANRNGGAIDWAMSRLRLKHYPRNIIDITLSSQQQIMQQMAQHRLEKHGGKFYVIDETLTAHSAAHVGLDQVSPWAIETLIGNARYSSKVVAGEQKLQEILKHGAAKPRWFNGPNKNTEE